MMLILLKSKAAIPATSNMIRKSYILLPSLWLSSLLSSGRDLILVGVVVVVVVVVLDVIVVTVEEENEEEEEEEKEDTEG